MTGLIFALAPFLASIAVARRQPAHRPIRDALGVSAWYSLCSTLAGPGAKPWALLCLWGLVALASGLAYLAAFEENVGICGAPLSAIIGLVVGDVLHRERWPVATWGPFVASSVVGALSLWRWRASRNRNDRLAKAYLTHGFDGDGGPISVHDLRLRESMSIAQRTALLLLASDVCMLAFVRWPGVQIWQGRVAAMAIAGVQLGWLLTVAERDAHVAILEVLQGGAELRGRGIIDASKGRLRRGTAYVYLNSLEDDGLIISRRLPSGERSYRAVHMIGRRL